MLKSRWQRWLKTRHIWMLVTLLLLEVLYPVSASSIGGYDLLTLFFLLVLAACVFAAADRRHYLLTAIFLAVPAVLSFCIVLGFSLNEQPAPVWLVWSRLLATVLLLAYAAIVILLDALRADEIDADKICAGVSVYLLLGLIWALLYSMADLVSPGALLVPELPGEEIVDKNGLENYGVFIYFSFVTLTTVGYGDILPVTPQTRMLAWLEAVLGQIYLAVLIARIVGLHVAHHLGKRAH